MSRALTEALQGRRVLLVRHGNTGKAEVDADRRLTETGQEQCRKFREAWAEHFQGVTAVLASPVARTMETASLLAAPLGLEVLPVEDLYFVRPWRTDAMRAADKDCGYAPIAVYIERHPGAHDAAGEVMAAAVARASTTLPLGDLLIVGHAGYLSFLALEVVTAMAPTMPEPEAWREGARRVVLDANVGEVCGFEIGANGARYLPNPEATDFTTAKTNDAFVAGSGADGS